jgi:hypothetical protein
VPGDEACDRSVTRACTSQDLLALRRYRGVAGPIPGALGNLDLVVVVGVAPVNLAGRKIGDPVLGDRATGEDFWSTPNRFGLTPRADSAARRACRCGPFESRLPVRRSPDTCLARLPEPVTVVSLLELEGLPGSSSLG